MPELSIVNDLRKRLCSVPGGFCAAIPRKEWEELKISLPPVPESQQQRVAARHPGIPGALFLTASQFSETAPADAPWPDGWYLVPAAVSEVD